MDNNTSFAIMPIVSAIDGGAFGQEILLRKFNSIPLEVFNRNPELYTEFSFELLTDIFKIDATKNIRTEAELLFINFTVKQFLSAGTLDFLTTAHTTNTRLHNIVIEITEQELLYSDVRIQERILLFKRFGCLFAIDDFGTEHSNFKNVFDLNPNYIKLDGDMIFQYCQTDVCASALVKLVAFCHELGAKVIAEGVENIDIYKKVKDMNIDYVQGYYLGKPELIPSTK